MHTASICQTLQQRSASPSSPTENVVKYAENAAARADTNTTQGTQHKTRLQTSLKASHTFDAIALLDRAQHFELLQHVYSVVQHIEDYWNEDGKADSPSGAS